MYNILMLLMCPQAMYNKFYLCYRLLVYVIYYNYMLCTLYVDITSVFIYCLFFELCNQNIYKKTINHIYIK